MRSLVPSRKKRKSVVSAGQSESSEMAFSKVHSSMPYLPAAVDTKGHDHNTMNLGKLKSLKFLIPYNQCGIQVIATGITEQTKVIRMSDPSNYSPISPANGTSVELVLTFNVGFGKDIYEEICICSSCDHSLLLISEEILKVALLTCNTWGG